MSPIDIDAKTITWILLCALLLLIFLKGVVTVGDGYTRVVERLGRRARILRPGINVIIPFLEKIKKDGFDIETTVENGAKNISLVVKKSGDISMREHRMDPATLKLLCRDNSEVHINPVAYFRIEDPMRTVYDVSDFKSTFKSMIETTLRQEIGKFDGDTIVTSREVLSENLRRVLQEAGSAWGIKILRVEIEDIGFDKEVTEKLSMARRQELIRRQDLVSARAKADKEILEAEADKKALILRAEGEREAAIKKAEGEKQAQILKAQGDFEQQKLEAEAKFLLAAREQEGLAQGYAAIAQSLSANPQAVISLEALRAQQKIAESLGQSTNALIVPTETVGLFGAAAVAIKGAAELLRPSPRS